MNILFTNLCNRNCVYCFAKKQLSRGKDGAAFLSPENLRIIMAFLKRSNEAGVGILGGEPTLHPDFARMISDLLGQGFGLNVFTNGVISQRAVDFLEKNMDKKLKLLINIHPLSSYNVKQRKQLVNTMEKLGKISQLGFNIYKKDFNADFLLGLVKKYGLHKSIRLGIANPLLGENNTHIPAGMHGRIAGKIVRLAKICDAEDISLNFDCGFTLCSFSEKQLGRLFYYNSVFHSHCYGAIDVGPNLEVWRCFATSGLWKRKLSDFKNLSEAIEFYDKKFEPFKLMGLKNKCLNCKYLKRRQCSGGCLTHALAAFKMDTNYAKSI